MSKDSKVSNQLGNVTSIDPTKTKAVFDSRYSSYEIIIGKDDTSTINEPITYNSLVVFSDPVSISVKSNDNKLVFNNKVIIKNIVFEKEVTFEDIIFEHEVLFENITFNMKVTFKKVVFKKGVDFKSTIFKNADFDFVVFNGEADFKKATFNNDISFKYTTFKERGAFAEITLIENISFECLVLNDKSHIYFRNTTEKIDTGLYKNKKISIRDTVINGRIDFNNNKIGIIDLRGSVVIGSGTINMIDFNPKCENHQTATVLKNEAIKRNDIIKALEYKAEEKNLYAKALKHHAKEKIKSIFKKTNQLADKNTSNFKGVQWISEILSILLSRVSNNHGQNWGQALIVTFFVGLIFFLLFYLVYITSMPINPQETIASLNISLPLYFKNFFHIFSDPTVTATKAINIKLNMFFPEFFKYLIPTDYKLLVKFMDNSQVHSGLKSLGASIYIAGKVWIAYGVFEIIEAFRKFNKIS